MQANGRAANDGRRIPRHYIDRWIDARETIDRARSRYDAAIKQADALLKVEIEQAVAQIRHCQEMLLPLVEDGGRIECLRGPESRPEYVTLRPSKCCGGVELHVRELAQDIDLEWPDAEPVATVPVVADAVADAAADDLIEDLADTVQITYGADPVGELIPSRDGN
jgi:hypothetical protein